MNCFTNPPKEIAVHVSTYGGVRGRQRLYFFLLKSITFVSYLIGLGNSFQNIRISLTGQNLLLLTKYTGFDPEVNTGSSSGGIQTFGIDRFTYPSAKTFLFGINMTF